MNEDNLNKTITIGWLLLMLIPLAALVESIPDPATIESEASDVVSMIETTSITTDTTTTTITTTTSYSETTYTTTTTSDPKNNLLYLGEYTGTYFKGDMCPCYGKAGRILIDCYPKEDTYKGSVAAVAISDQYGFDMNGKTMIYIEIPSYPEMNGWYSIDDQNADGNIIDFYFPDYALCPWQNDGVTTVYAWII